MNLRQLMSLIAAALLLACSGSAPMWVAEAVSNAEALDGRQVTVRGVIRVSDDLIGVKASLDVRSECIGLVIPDDQRSEATAFDGRWGYVSGELDAEACGPEAAVCRNTCGPAAIVEPRFIVD